MNLLALPLGLALALGTAVALPVHATAPDAATTHEVKDKKTKKKDEPVVAPDPSGPGCLDITDFTGTWDHAHTRVVTVAGTAELVTAPLPGGTLTVGLTLAQQYVDDVAHCAGVQYSVAAYKRDPLGAYTLLDDSGPREAGTPPAGQLGGPVTLGWTSEVPGDARCIYVTAFAVQAGVVHDAAPSPEGEADHVQGYGDACEGLSPGRTWN